MSPEIKFYVMYTEINGLAKNDLWNIDKVSSIPGLVKTRFEGKIAFVNESENPIVVLRESVIYDEVKINPGQGVYLDQRGNVRHCSEYRFFKTV